jgi:flagellar hook-associated protein 1 FlgK
MTTLSGLLNIGRSSLATHQAAIGVVSGNTANADTVGYARREVRIQSVVGGGVGVAAIARRSSVFLEQRVLGANARFGANDAKASGLGAVESALNDGEMGIGARVDAWFASLRTLSVDPTDLQLRADVIARGESVASGFAMAAEAIARERSGADAAIGLEVDRVNQLTTAIARTNATIGAAAPGSDAQAQSIDERERLVHELSGLVEIKTMSGENGSLTVLLQGGPTLVQKDRAATLRATADAALGGLSRVDLLDPSGAPLDVTQSLRGGSLGGRLELRDDTLADLAGALDNLAFDLANAFNAVHAAGYGTDGATGRDFFAVPATAAGAAQSMALAAGLEDNPAWLATASDAATAVGGNENLLALLDVADTRFAMGGTATPGQAIASIIGTVGRETRAARDIASDASGQLEQTRALYQSEVGVSIDEELVDLTRFERAYQAGARIIETVERLYEAVLSL